MYTAIDNSLDSEPESTALLTDSAKKVQPFPPGNILRNLIPLVLSRYNMLSYRVTPHSSSSAGRICLLIYASLHSSAVLMHRQWLEFELPWAEGAQFWAGAAVPWDWACWSFAMVWLRKPGCFTGFGQLGRASKRSQGELIKTWWLSEKLLKWASAWSCMPRTAYSGASFFCVCDHNTTIELQPVECKSFYSYIPLFPVYFLQAKNEQMPQISSCTVTCNLLCSGSWSGHAVSPSSFN